MLLGICSTDFFCVFIFALQIQIYPACFFLWDSGRRQVGNVHPVRVGLRRRRQRSNCKHVSPRICHAKLLHAQAQRVSHAAQQREEELWRECLVIFGGWSNISSCSTNHDRILITRFVIPASLATHDNDTTEAK